MRKLKSISGGSTTEIIFDASLRDLTNKTNGSRRPEIIFVTDENIFRLHAEKFSGHNAIVLKAGEAQKQMNTVNFLLAEMLRLNATRSAVLIAVGGGVVTDIAGFAAAIYKRGIEAIFVPTTILGMTDAALGGKNGVNFGELKNMIGTTKQASQIVYDFDFLRTLPESEVASGFAEIIKHACIKDAKMFAQLELHSPAHYLATGDSLHQLIEDNVKLKLSVVEQDVYETGERFLLNFGHSFGHALETLHGISHGDAIAIGMRIAAFISVEVAGLPAAEAARINELLDKYGLDRRVNIDAEATLGRMRKDKKAGNSQMKFILLEETGKGIVREMTFDSLADHLNKYINAG